MTTSLKNGKNSTRRQSGIDATTTAVLAGEFVDALGANSSDAQQQDVCLVRECAISDLIDTAKFLRRLGVNEEIWRRFSNLAQDLNDLKQGTIAPIFMPSSTARAHNRSLDESNVRLARVKVAIALECLLKSGKSRSVAARDIGRQRPLQALLRRGSSVESACLKWFDQLRRYGDKNWNANDLWTKWREDADAERSQGPPEQWLKRGEAFLKAAVADAGLLARLR